MDRKKKQGVEISFFAAECMEFSAMGEILWGIKLAGGGGGFSENL